MTATAKELVELLDLETLDTDLFRGNSPDTDRQRVFGGQVAAQALTAAVRTVDEGFGVHSLHAYFLRPGDTSVPIIYDAERIRDGRSFQTRRVVARQHGHGIFYLTANFQRPEEGYDHQDTMPAVAPPEDGMSFEQIAAVRDDVTGGHDTKWFREWDALDVQWLGNTLHPQATSLDQDTEHPARAQLWIRIRDELPDDPTIHLACFTYATDLTLLGASLIPHDVTIISPEVMPASLDHTIWFHRPFRADQWWLYDQWSPSASGGRGLSLARVFTREGTLVATVAQEGLIRRRTR